MSRKRRLRFSRLILLFVLMFGFVTGLFLLLRKLSIDLWNRISILRFWMEKIPKPGQNFIIDFSAGIILWLFGCLLKLILGKPLKWVWSKVKSWIYVDSSVLSETRERVYARVSSPSELSKAMTLWYEMFLENPPAQDQLLGYGFERFFEKLFIPSAEPIDFESGHRMYLVIGPPGVGKSLFLLCSLRRWLKTGQVRWWRRHLPWAYPRSSKHHVLFLNPQHHDKWAQGLVVEELENALLVLDGAWRSSDTKEEFQKRMNNLARMAFGGFQEADDPTMTITGRVVVTMREEDFEEIRRHPPPAWPESSQICQVHLRPFTSDDPKFHSLIERYVRAFKVDLGEQKHQAIRVIEERSEGSPFYVAALCSQFQGKRPSLEALQAIPKSFANLFVREMASRFWNRGSDEALRFTLCLLATAILPLSRAFLRTACVKFKGDLTLINDFLDRFCVSVDKETITLTGHIRTIVLQMFCHPSTLDPLRGMAQRISAYYHDHFYGDLEQLVKTALERIRNSKFQETLSLLGDVAALGQPYLEDATAIFQERENLLERRVLQNLKVRFYEAWVHAARVAWGSDHYEKAVRSYDQAFAFFVPKVVDANMHRLNLHAWASLARKYVLPITRQQDKPQLIERIRRAFSKILELERELQITDPATINGYAHFLWDIGEYPYREAEKWFQKAVEAATGNSLQQVRQRIIAKQAYAVFLWQRAQEAWGGHDFDSFSDDTQKAEILFRENGEELESIRGRTGGNLPVELHEVDGAHLCATAEFYRVKANYVAQQNWRQAQGLDRRALQLLQTAVARYPHVARLHNAFAVALSQTARRYLPEYKKTWYSKAMEHLEKARKISLEHNQYFQASITFNIRMTIAIKHCPSPPFHELEKEALEVLEWDIPKRQKAILHNTMADLYHEWFLQERTLATVGRLRELLRKAHEHLDQAWKTLPKSSENYKHLVRVWCKFARHCQLAGNQRAIKEHLQKALDLAQSAASLSRAVLTVCQIGEEFLEAGKGELSHDPQAAFLLLRLCSKQASNFTLPRTAVSRLKLDLTKAKAEMAKDVRSRREVASMCLENAKWENTEVSYGVYRHILGEIKKRTKGMELDERLELAEKMLSLSREAYRLCPSKSQNCLDLACDLIETAILLESARKKREVEARMREANQYLAEALERLEEEDQPPELYRRYKSRVLQQKAKVLLRLGERDEARKTWEEAVSLEQRSRGHLEFADRCLVAPPKGFDDPNEALRQYQLALKMLEKDDDAIEWLVNNLPRFSSALTNILAQTVWNQSVRKLAFMAVIYQQPDSRARQAAWAGRLAERKGDNLLWWYSNIVTVRWTFPGTEHYEKNWEFLRECAQALQKKEEVTVIDKRLQSATPPRHNAEGLSEKENPEGDTVRSALRHAILEELHTMHTKGSPLSSFQTVAQFIEESGLDTAEDDFLDVLFIVDALRRYGASEKAVRLLESLASRYPNRHRDSLPYGVAARLLRLTEEPRDAANLRRHFPSKEVRVGCPLCQQKEKR